MKIQEQDFYHGAALTQIIESEYLKSINRINARSGLYKINDTKRVLIKYSGTERTDDEMEWPFTFRADDFKELSGHDSFIVLVCAGNTICLLSYKDINEVLDIGENTPLWVRVSYPPRGRMRIRGPKGDLSHTVPHNAFPRNIFGGLTQSEEEFDEMVNEHETPKTRNASVEFPNLAILHVDSFRSIDEMGDEYPLRQTQALILTIDDAMDWASLASEVIGNPKCLDEYSEWLNRVEEFLNNLYDEIDEDEDLQKCFANADHEAYEEIDELTSTLFPETEIEFENEDVDLRHSVERMVEFWVENVRQRLIVIKRIMSGDYDTIAVLERYRKCGSVTFP